MLSLYNTLTRKKELLKPLKKSCVSLYTCGPTVYNFAHIGNLRTYVFEDILKRVLQYNGLKVKHIMNITDVGHLTSDADEGEDKMEKGATREGKTAWDIAKFYTAAFIKDLKLLNILPADKMPRATDHIKEQIALIKILERKGFAYRTSDGMYFDTGKLADYGKLAAQNFKDKKAGARVEVNKEKHMPWDFALWKFSSKGAKRQMEWKSPWGVGFPGWHIECSAMARAYLGQPFDIHCGGIDHITIHHTNEIAQSEAAYDTPLARVWMHGEFVVIGEQEKMAKSVNNFLRLDALMKNGFSPLAYRYLLLGTHYRSPLAFSFSALQAAQNALDALYDAVRDFEKPRIGCAEFEEKFKSAVDDDLNIPKALGVMWNLMKSAYPSHAKAKSLLKFDTVLGLGLARVLGRHFIIPARIRALAQAREKARLARDWEESDSLRMQLENAGYQIEDAPKGYRIKKTHS
ncbi:MAG: cysteine--tRNA ligase [Candidatus Magasanikbacteria bacterium]|nr:cysteine--tRNA ligase [Candidatus Magasanikbacteria bacterium]